MQIEATSVPRDVLDGARAIARSAGLDVCGIEFLMDDRDGRPYFYDINALSNFVTDAVRIVGFDPFERFVDYLEGRLGVESAVGAAGASIAPCASRPRRWSLRATRVRRVLSFTARRAQATQRSRF